MNDFADQLTHWREFRGLTQQQLSDKSQIAFNTISELERRVTLRPRMSTAKLLADALSLAGEDRAIFLAAARAGSVPGARPEAGTGPEALCIERAVPRMLRRDIESFTGREAEVAQLVAAGPAEPGTGGVVGIYVIEGMGGVGKTSLALRAAHQIATHFPDGQLFLDLQGYTPGARRLGSDRALRSALHALGVREELLPRDRVDRAALYRSLLAGTRTLIVLDNAADLAQVEPLLPGTAGCMVIITSRRGLGGLEDARTIRLETPPPQEAIRLFRAIAGQGTVSPDDENVAKIVDLCGCLPLAIRITAARLAHRRNPSTDEVLADLSRERRRLAHFADEKQNVTAAFEMSFHHLPEDAQRTFASLGLIPGPDFDAYAAASLVGAADISDVKARLDTLLDHNLLIDDTPGRFRFHDLVREFAQDKSADASRDDLDRLLDFYLFCAQTADGHLDRRIPAVSPRRYPRTPRTAPRLATPAQAHAWFAVEARNLADAARAADEGGSPQRAVVLSFALAEYLRANGPWNMAAELHQLALDAATRRNDRVAQAAALVHAGVLERQTGSLAEAVSTLSRAVETCPAGARLTLGGALIELGTALRLTGQASEANEKFHAALSNYEAEGSILGRAGTLRELSGVQFQLGEFELAEQSLSKAFPLYKQLGNRYGEAGTLAYLGGLRLAIKDYAGALEVLNDAYEIYRDLDDPICQANCLLFLGRAHLDTGMLDSAKDTLLKALRFYTEFGDRRGVAGSLGFLGDAQRLSGEPELAEKSLSDAVSLFHELRDLGGEAETANLHAGLAFSRGEWQIARHRYARALRLGRTIPSGKDQADALAGIAECNQSECRPAAAVRNYRRALKLYQAMKCDTDADRVSRALDTLSD
jgi:tetratricopeptide (TPR) repeat protein/transcriptional regulator with XRE-family HTH domain